MVSLLFLILVTAVLMVLTRISVKRLRDGEHGVVFHMGTPRGGRRGPGFVFLVPFVESLTRIDVRTRTARLRVRGHTRDGLRAEVEVNARYRVVDPEKSAVGAAGDPVEATERALHAAVRQRVAGTDLDRVPAAVEEMNGDLGRASEELTGPWGVALLGVRVESVRWDRR